MEADIENSIYTKKAEEYYENRYSRSQSVFLIVSELCGINRKTVLVSFGGGTGKHTQIRSYYAAT